MKKKVGLLFLSLLATNLLSVHGQAEETDAIVYTAVHSRHNIHISGMYSAWYAMRKSSEKGTIRIPTMDFMVCFD